MNYSVIWQWFLFHPFSTTSKAYPRYNSRTGTTTHEAIAATSSYRLHRIANLNNYCWFHLQKLCKYAFEGPFRKYNSWIMSGCQNCLHLWRLSFQEENKVVQQYTVFKKQNFLKFMGIKPMIKTRREERNSNTGYSHCKAFSQLL